MLPPRLFVRASQWGSLTSRRSRLRRPTANLVLLDPETPQRCFSSPVNDLHPAIQRTRSSSTSDHLQFDKTHLWHPYTSLVEPTPVLPVSHARGCTIFLEESPSSPSSSIDDEDALTTKNTALLDGMSSWWAAVWGYQHPVLDAAVQKQLKQMSHVMFGGFTHRPATELASMLLHMIHGSGREGYSEDDLSKIFYTDSGSVAVEVALKMALQHHRGMIHNNRKTKIVSVRSGYHGDTLGAMSVCDPINGMHKAFQGVLPEQFFVSRPPCDATCRVGNATTQGCAGCTCRQDGEEVALQNTMQELEGCFAANHEQIAALICEPVVQGAGGMRFYSPKYLQRARELCTEYNILLICDEIATGFGRSGGESSPFASLEVGVQPDILCLGKALTGGYMTLGAVVTTERVARSVSSSPSSPNNNKKQERVMPLPLMHGPTFMASPLACAVAVASTNLMMQLAGNEPQWKTHVRRIEQELRTNLKKAADLPGVADVRVRGAVGVVELKKPLDNTKVPYRCQELGVWLRPFGKLLYTMPPYIMSNEELKQVTDAMLILAEENT